VAAAGELPRVAARRRHPEFVEAISRLKWADYSEIVLVGHSAGGLVVRQFVEENPDAGVTKVVQVAAPNTGSGWAELVDAVRPLQKPFVDSLRKGVRASWEEKHGRKPLPDHVQFVCIVGTGLGLGDGVVSAASQWPKDLQEQGVPAVVFRGDHGSVVFGRAGARLIAETVRQNFPRGPQNGPYESELLRSSPARR
jgi:pimeloyl-ACP methyl ester carboxylesterase